MARVDSFRLLHSLLREIFQLSTRREIFADIGEELLLVGEVENGVCKARITCPQTITSIEVTVPEFLFVLVSLAAEVSRSIREGGVDLDDYNTKFPPMLSDKREGWIPERRSTMTGHMYSARPTPAAASSPGSASKDHQDPK
jgi:hypothetical protein